MCESPWAPFKGFWPSQQSFLCPHPSLFSPPQFSLCNCSSQIRRAALFMLNCDVQGGTWWSVWKKPWAEEAPCWGCGHTRQIIPLAIWVSPWAQGKELLISFFTLPVLVWLPLEDMMPCESTCVRCCYFMMINVYKELHFEWECNWSSQTCLDRIAWSVLQRHMSYESVGSESSVHQPFFTCRGYWDKNKEVFGASSYMCTVETHLLTRGPPTDHCFGHFNCNFLL